MIASMELQRPRITPVLPQWDLGVVLEALSKSPYEPLQEASFKHFTLKTVFLLAMASAGRRSELHALRFDQNYIQLKPKGLEFIPGEVSSEIQEVVLIMVLSCVHSVRSRCIHNVSDFTIKVTNTLTQTWEGVRYRDIYRSIDKYNL